MDEWQVYKHNSNVWKYVISAILKKMQHKVSDCEREHLYEITNAFRGQAHQDIACQK